MITFTGYKLSKLQKDIIAEAVGSALDVLVSKRMKRTLFFEIFIEKDLYKERNIWGDMDIEDDEEQSPKFYTIRLNYSGVESFAKMLETLAHELVHVEQFATRRLRHLAKPFHVTFDKERYNTLTTKYYERPWEIEAHELEKSVYNYMVKSSSKVQRYVTNKSDESFGEGL
ncbi:hypothetical protein CMO86_08255 [Candidatus Woesearchaeota archaeon]|jgi:hypothetical protein|nr:hypothetical protein [Candidatus Woesearchaeota archaeon]|tara:strand:- start:170 stop:682 length:513 start_codon:yes stop_codon:yes gene_type:complete